MLEGSGSGFIVILMVLLVIGIVVIGAYFFLKSKDRGSEYAKGYKGA